ncbi:MAG: alanine racemase [Flavobacteriales bacterium]|nr:MAG: alanine racemase [Flavobacteriales bacterium]
MNKITETTVEIDLEALTHNFHLIKSILKPTTKVLGVVKASAYGVDSMAIARKLTELNIDYLAVAYVREGLALRQAGITTPVMVLHPQEGSFELILKHKLEPVMYNKRIFNLFLAVVNEKNIKNYPIHLKFNTGLNRLGFTYEELSFLIEKLNTHTNVKVASIFSHLTASEDHSNIDFTTKQFELFDKITAKLLPVLKEKPILHILNTSGIFNFPQHQYDMVRTGIGLYGFANDNKFTKSLKNVISLKTVISQINEVRKGESVGYNFGFIADKDYKIATSPIGHADGISRSMGKGKIFVTINNQKAAVIGNVCMDMIMIDVTDIDCKESDEVIIFNNQEMVNQLAVASNTISYEILTSLSKRMKRLIK